VKVAPPSALTSPAVLGLLHPLVASWCLPPPTTRPSQRVKPPSLPLLRARPAFLPHPSASAFLPASAPPPATSRPHVFEPPSPPLADGPSLHRLQCLVCCTLSLPLGASPASPRPQPPAPRNASSPPPSHSCAPAPPSSRIHPHPHSCPLLPRPQPRRARMFSNLPRRRLLTAPPSIACSAWSAAAAPSCCLWYPLVFRYVIALCSYRLIYYLCFFCIFNVVIYIYSHSVF
jgi:hypothetical protein